MRNTSSIQGEFGEQNTGGNLLIRTTTKFAFWRRFPRSGDVEGDDKVRG
jgi:hypothetical protein